MNQHANLTQFLTNLNLVAAEQIECYVGNVRLMPRGVTVSTADTQHQIALFDAQYDADLVIERYPHKRHSPELLMGQVSAWLLQNDYEGPRSDEGYPLVQIEVEVNDAETADVVIQITFYETEYGVEDPQGPIELNGKRYRLAERDIWVAEIAGDVTGEVV